MLEDYLIALEDNIKAQYPKAEIVYQIMEKKGYETATTVVQILFTDAVVSMENSVSVFETISFAIFADRKINDVTNNALSRKAFLAQRDFAEKMAFAIEDSLEQIGDSIDNQKSTIEIGYGDIGQLKFGEGSIACAVSLLCNVTLKR